MSGIRPQSGKGSLSATNLATYHHVNCDLFLHKVYHGSPEQRDNGGQQPSALKAAIYERGIRWESYLFSWLDENGLLLTIPSKPIVSSELVQNLINDERDHFFLAGLTFFPPVNELVKHFAAAGRRPVKFGIAKPDLVEITRNSDGRLEWKVIDAKSSNSVKTSHHVQIYFYTLCLKYLLPDSQFTSSGNAAIWLPPVEGFSSSIPSFNDIKTITTSLLSSSLDNFFFSQLPRIIFLDRKAVSWHYNPMCRGCPYTSECRDTAVQQGELGSMSNISIEDARSLRYLLRMSHDEDIVSSAHLSDIEDLSSLISDRGKLGRLSRKFPMTVKKVRRILSMPVREADKNISPVLNAASTKAIQVIPRRNFTCPSQEDIAVIISLLQDPSTPGMEIVSFGISVKSTTDIPLPRNIHGRGEDLIPALAALIDKILALEAPSRSTQFFVFSAGELSALQGHLINAALTSSHEDHQVRLCIGALSQGASLLQTTFQPVLLSGVLLEFLAKTQRTKFELQRCLERMGLDTEGPVPVLRQRIQSALALYQSAGHGDIARKKELGQLPRVVVVKKEIDLLLALPIPGFWDLTDCASVLLPSTHGDHCVTDEVIFGTYAEGSSITHFLEQRNETTYAVLQSMRARVKQYSQNLLVNEAKVLSASFMDICRENESLRKLFFMQQFEVLAKLTELWKARIDGCPNAPVLQYESSTQSVAGSEHSFILVSGTLDAPPGDKDRSFYDYLLVQDGDDDQIPVESLFDDLLVSSLVFPLNKYTKARWTDQHSRVQSELFIADIRDIQSDAQPARITVILRTWGGWGAKFTPGNFYRISPRLVDFNVTKVLSTLVELDFRCTDIDSSHIPFVQLIVDPSTFGRDKEIMESKAQKKRGGGIQSLFRELSNLNVESAGALVLKASQNRASQRILSNRLSVVWGPPGTGKTHTIAASLLRLMEVQHLENPDRRRVIFVTAMTHAAIDACLKKLYYLRDCYLDIEGLPTEWLSSVSFNHVLKGSEQHAPPKSPGSHLYAGTVYQLFNFTKKHPFEVDCLVIDEAGQLSLGAASLVLRSLSSSGKIVVAGDSEQLAPILAAQYPQLKTRALFGSILDSLMYSFKNPNPADRPDSPTLSDDVQHSQETVVQLTENFRLNPDLGEFVSTIYSRAFKPQKAQTRHLATALKSVRDELGQDFCLDPTILESVQWCLIALSNVMLHQPQNILVPPSIQNVPYKERASSEFDAPHPISLALLRLQTFSSKTLENVGYEIHVKAEAEVAAALAVSILRCSPKDDIFIATPHRIQRHAVKAALHRAMQAIDEMNLLEAMDNFDIDEEHGTPDPEPVLKDQIRVDTVERLQGSEAAFVICLFSLPQPSAAELAFLLERRRLNVAISRAKTLCILIASPEVLRPSIHVLSNENSAKGFEFLKAFEARAWSAPINVDVEDL